MINEKNKTGKKMPHNNKPDVDIYTLAELQIRSLEAAISLYKKAFILFQSLNTAPYAMPAIQLKGTEIDELIDLNLWKLYLDHGKQGYQKEAADQARIFSTPASFFVKVETFLTTSKVAEAKAEKQGQKDRLEPNSVSPAKKEAEGEKNKQEFQKHLSRCIKGLTKNINDSIITIKASIDQFSTINQTHRNGIAKRLKAILDPFLCQKKSSGETGNNKTTRQANGK